MMLVLDVNDREFVLCGYNYSTRLTKDSYCLKLWPHHFRLSVSQITRQYISSLYLFAFTFLMLKFTSTMCNLTVTTQQINLH